MTIQVGVPGNAGGTSGGGATNEIAQAGGRVTVEADGSITLEPAPGSDGDILLKGVANSSAPLLRWDDDFGGDDLTFGIEKVNGANLDDMNIGAAILAASSTLGIGIRGNNSSFDITSSGVEMKAPRWLITTPGPHAWGRTSVFNNKQYTYGGNLISGGFEDVAVKFELEGNLTGAPGDTVGIFGFRVGPDFITQTAVESIALIAALEVPIAVITDNLTGLITKTAGLHIEGPMVGGVTNYAILVDAGLTQLQQMHVPDVGPHTFGDASLLGFVQYSFGGNLTLPSSAPKKMQLVGQLTGQAGAQNYVGLDVGPSVATQAVAEQVTSIWGTGFRRPGLTNNLLSANVILNAATVRIDNETIGATNNYALLVSAGRSSLFNLEHAGTLLGFYGTPQVVKPTVAGAKGGNAALTSLIAALLGQGLIADTTT